MQRAAAYDLDILQRLAVTETTLAGVYGSPLLSESAHMILSAASRLLRTLHACNAMQCNAMQCNAMLCYS